MAGEIIVITQAGCEACAQLRREMPDLKYVDVSDPRIGKLADELGVGYVPSILLVEDGKVCLLDGDLKPIKCVRGKL